MSDLQTQFTYESLDRATTATLQTYAREINVFMAKTLENIIDIGKRLKEAQELLRHNKHGGFEGWLRAEFNWSRKTAYRFINVYDTFGNRVTVTQLENVPLKALYAFAAPSTPEAVRQAVIERIEQGETITYTQTRSLVENATPDPIPQVARVPDVTQPHVSHNSGNNEWNTPPEFIQAAREVMGTIDLDPASSLIANKTVNALEFYSREDDGLTKRWSGRVWMNPPYSSGLIEQFCAKLQQSVQEHAVSEAIVLVNNATETGWFLDLISVASAVVFPTQRIKFISPIGQLGAPLQGQAFIYIGEHTQAFIEIFSRFGWGAVL